MLIIGFWNCLPLCITHWGYLSAKIVKLLAVKIASLLQRSSTSGLFLLPVILPPLHRAPPPHPVLWQHTLSVAAELVPPWCCKPDSPTKQLLIITNMYQIFRIIIQAYVILYQWGIWFPFLQCTAMIYSFFHCQTVGHIISNYMNTIALDVYTCIMYPF